MRRFTTALLVCAFAAGLAVAKKQDFTGQDLRGKNFDGQMLDGSDFTGTLVQNVRFERTRLRNTIWKDANMQMAAFPRADLKGADFRDAVMRFEGNYMILTEANFEGLDMDEFSCLGCNFEGANLRDTERWGLMAKANFRKADFRGADMHTLRVLEEDLNDYSIFIGAVYDDETVWPDWVDMAKLKAKKIGPDDPAPVPVP